jgi:hypothetical protein
MVTASDPARRLGEAGGEKDCCEEQLCCPKCGFHGLDDRCEPDDLSSQALRDRRAGQRLIGMRTRSALGRMLK